MSAAKSILVAVLFAASFAGVASARDEIFTVKLSTPVTTQTRVIALNTVWSCDGDTCLARPAHAATVRSCRQFVHQAGGHVTAYGSAERQLSADEIARCNGEATVQSAQN